MSTYIISDIHGQYDAFIVMLKKINFNKNDVMYIVGDIIDRGSQNIKLIRYIKEQKNIHTLMGNHEDMMLTAFRTNDKFDKAIWYKNGGDETMNEFLQLSKSEQKEILNWIKTFEFTKELEVNDKKYILGHACPWAKSNDDILWTRISPEDCAPDNNYYIAGHTPTIMFNDKPIITQSTDHHIYFIDCGSAFGKNLGCLRLNDMKEFYVSIG